MLELTGLPSQLTYNELIEAINAHAPPGFRFAKLTLNPGLARLSLQAHEVSQVMAALQGKPVKHNYNLIVQLGASGGRSLSSQERQALQAAVGSVYNASSKSLGLGSLAQRHNLPFVNFQSTQFVNDLLNAMHAVAPDTVSLDLSANQIATLAPFTGLFRALPHLQNLALQGNFINRSNRILTPAQHRIRRQNSALA